MTAVTISVHHYLRKRLLRTLYITHRWLGISMGILMMSWCLSGMVMLWQPWPTPDRVSAEKVHGLFYLPTHLPLINALNEYGARFQSFRLSMTGSEPVLTLVPISGPPVSIDLRTGRAGSITPNDASMNAAAYASSVGVQSPPVFTGTTTDDQWVLDTPGRLTGFERFRFSGPQELVVYISSLTGDVVQATDTSSRAWSWMGAIPHWLYPAILRRNPLMWKWTVILLAGIGMFLTATGLSIGLLRLRRRWPFSYYRRWHLAHHLGGMMFGLLALSWITTGFFTMNPGGVFASEREARSAVHVTGSVTGEEILAVLNRIVRLHTVDWTDVSSAFLKGHIFLAVTDSVGNHKRLDAQLSPSPLTTTELGASATFLASPDLYYFNRPTHTRHFPVIRMAAANGTLFYLDARTGEVITAFDSAAQKSRWWVYGPHNMDFWSWLRSPTARLMVIFPTLCCVLSIYITGVTIGMRRLGFIKRR
ncbi:hypothetical protein AD948_10600 [Acetobacter senegalensis]|uniref:PepSY domain-containing protein n=2 Tax=Acetobacter senegalensis TaxID=446692 RepID=A0A149U021_9PROT|nr:PepSY domain-containing protein [Acetobacter senegalensis]KXV58771.1 hypothetical protein AD948_10600 [Acetobacter senegalensis]